MQPADLATKLAALHDIVVPAPVPWWPPAPGWYAVLALAIALAGWCAWRLYDRWRGNAYRRTGLRQLAAIRASLADPGRRAAALSDLADLLRRGALHVAPRERVAALSGDAWLAFLDDGMGGHAFRSDTGRLIIAAPYQPAVRIAQISQADLDALCALAERWLRRHRVSRYVSAAR